MSTVDTKAPPSPPADLLDALVQQQLQRDAPAPPPRNPSPPPQTPVPSAPDEAPTADLQREIDVLLNAAAPTTPAPHPHSTNADRRSKIANPSASAQPSEDAGQPAPSASPLPPISREELDVLLAQNAPAVSVAATPAPASSAAHPDQLTEAEGVLADELAKLISDAAPELPPAPPATAAAPKVPSTATRLPTQDEGVLPAEHARLGTAPASATTAPGIPAAAAPVAPPTTENRTSNIEAPPASASSASPAAASSTESSAFSPAPIVESTSSRARPARHVLGDLLLMFAQLLDLPFGWLDDLSKNVIGMAAFLLLLGGLVLWLLARTAPF